MRFTAVLPMLVATACVATAQEQPPPPSSSKIECKLFPMGNQDANFRSSGLSFGGGRGDGGSLGVTLPEGWTAVNAIVVNNAVQMAACHPKTEVDGR